MIFKAFGLEYFNFVKLKSLICRMFAGFWNLITQFAWYLKRFGLESLVCTVLAASWSQHLYYAGDYLQHFVLSAAFRIICSILSRVSFWIYFRLVRVYLGDQRMKRVEDQDEEGKGPGDQEDPGTRGPRDQRTRGTRGPGDQRIRGTWNCFSVNLYFCSSIIPATTSLTRKIKGSPGIPGQGTCRDQGPRPWHSSPSRRRPSAADHHVLNRGP